MKDLANNAVKDEDEKDFFILSSSQEILARHIVRHQYIGHELIQMALDMHGQVLPDGIEIIDRTIKERRKSVPPQKTKIYQVWASLKGYDPKWWLRVKNDKNEYPWFAIENNIKAIHCASRNLKIEDTCVSDPIGLSLIKDETANYYASHPNLINKRFASKERN